MWGQQGFWPPVDPGVSTLPTHQEPSYRPNYGSLPAQPHLWYPSYGQEQAPYAYKPYPTTALEGSSMHSSYSRSPPSITPNRPMPQSTSNLSSSSASSLNVFSIFSISGLNSASIYRVDNADYFPYLFSEKKEDGFWSLSDVITL